MKKIIHQKIQHLQIYMKISCKKFKNHLQFYMKILLKKFSSFFTGKSLVNFFQNHTLENIFQKLSPRGCFWKFSKISPTSPKFNTHKKVVVHFFIPMLLLPKTPPLTYPNIKKFKGPKMDSLHFHFHFHFHFHKDGGRRSIAGMAQHSIKPLLKEIPFILISFTSQGMLGDAGL